MSLTNLSLADRLSMEAAAHREAMASNPRSRVARVARPCPITGSEDENLLEYAIPIREVIESSQPFDSQLKRVGPDSYAIDLDESQSQTLEDDLDKFIDGRLKFTGDESCTDTQGEQPPNTPVTNPLADEDPIEALMSQEECTLDPDRKLYQQNTLMDMVAD